MEGMRRDPRMPGLRCRTAAEGAQVRLTRYWPPEDLRRADPRFQRASNAYRSKIEGFSQVARFCPGAQFS
jgi:hypothetical protein